MSLISKAWLEGESLHIKTGFLNNGSYKHISYEVINFKEKVIQEALIKLGWTPPTNY